MSKYASYAYGASLLLGGTMAYVSKGSLPSLVAGGGSGLCCLVLEILAVPNHPSTSTLSLSQSGVAFTVAGFMLSTYLKTQAPRALAIGSVSALASILYLYRGATSLPLAAKRS